MADWNHYTRLLDETDDLIPRDWAYELYDAIQERLAFAGATALPAFGELPYYGWLSSIVSASSKFAAAGSIDPINSDLFSVIASTLGVSYSELYTAYNNALLLYPPSRLYYNACRVACDLLYRVRFPVSISGGTSRIGHASGVGASASGTGSQEGFGTWSGVLASARSRFITDGGAESNPLSKSQPLALIYGLFSHDNERPSINPNYIVRRIEIELAKRVHRLTFPASCVGKSLDFEAWIQSYGYTLVFRDESPLHSDNVAWNHAANYGYFYVSGSDTEYLSTSSVWAAFDGQEPVEITGISSSQVVKTVISGYTPLSTSPVEFHLDLADGLENYPDPPPVVDQYRYEKRWQALRLSTVLVSDVSSFYNYQTPVTI